MAELANRKNVTTDEVPRPTYGGQQVFQLDMYGKYTQDDQYSNVIYYFDQMPWFAYNSITLDRISKPSDARMVNETEIKDEKFVVEVKPAMFIDDVNDRVFWRYPSKREEMVLEALKKIATMNNHSCIHEGEFGVFFSLSQIVKTLNNRYNRNEVKEALLVMAGSEISISKVGSKHSDTSNISSMISSLYLQSRAQWLESGEDCRCFVKLHDLTTRGIRNNLYRKIDLQTITSFKKNLSSLLYKRLVLMFTQSGNDNRGYEVTATRLLRDAGFAYEAGPCTYVDEKGKTVNKVRYFSDLVKPLMRALDELVEFEIISRYEVVKKIKERRNGKNLVQVDTKLRLIPAEKFIRDQIRANAEVANINFIQKLAKEDPSLKSAIDRMEPADFRKFTSLSDNVIESIRKSRNAELLTKSIQEVVEGVDMP